MGDLVNLLSEMTMSRFVEILKGKDMGVTLLNKNTCLVNTPFNGFPLSVKTDFRSMASVRYIWEECELDHIILDVKYDKELEKKIVDQILSSICSGFSETVFGSFLHNCRQHFPDQNNTRDDLQLYIAYATTKGRNIDRLKYYKASLLGGEALFDARRNKRKV